MNARTVRDLLRIPARVATGEGDLLEHCGHHLLAMTRDPDQTEHPPIVMRDEVWKRLGLFLWAEEPLEYERSCRWLLATMDNVPFMFGAQWETPHSDGVVAYTLIGEDDRYRTAYELLYDLAPDSARDMVINVYDNRHRRAELDDQIPSGFLIPGGRYIFPVELLELARDKDSSLLPVHEPAPGCRHHYTPTSHTSSYWYLKDAQRCNEAVKLLPEGPLRGGYAARAARSDWHVRKAAHLHALQMVGQVELARVSAAKELADHPDPGPCP